MKPEHLPPEVIIGECFMSDYNDRTIYLSVYCEHALDLTMRVEDRHGTVIQTQTNKVAAEGDIVKIQVEAILPGRFSLWLYYHDQVWERKIIIGHSSQ